jgi:hypothetical protein
MLTYSIRKRYGLPLKGPVDLSYRQKRFLIERETTLVGRSGLETEERFMLAWSDPLIYPEWLVWVRPATLKEDLYQKTDALMWLIDGRILRIQIKSIRSPVSRGSYTKEGIVLVKIDSTERLCQIRARTIDTILYYHKYHYPKSYHFFSP